jgi:hypothetical protein
MYAAFHDHQSIAKLLEEKEKEIAEKTRLSEEERLKKEANEKALQEKAAKDGRVCAECVIM